MSLLALIIAIGIVVDDSIVVSENVERYRAMGFSLKESVLKGASEVFSAVVAASLSLLSVLLPVSFIGGFLGRYLQQFSLGLAAAVLLSLLEAVLFLTVRLAYTPESKSQTWGDVIRSIIELPKAIRWGWNWWRKGFGIFVGIVFVLLAWVFTRRWYAPIAALVVYPLISGIVYYVFRFALTLLQALTTTLHGWTEAGVEWIRDVYARGLNSILHRGAWVLGISAAFLVGSALFIFVIKGLPLNFVPTTDSGFMGVNVRFPNGTPTLVANQESASGELSHAASRGRECPDDGRAIPDQVTIQLAPVGKKTRASWRFTDSIRPQILAPFPRSAVGTGFR